MAKAVPSVSATTTCTIPQEDPVQWPCLDAYATNGGIREAVNSSDCPLSISCESSDLLSEDNGDSRGSILDFSDILSNATSISSFKVEEGSANGIDHDEHPKALASVSAFTFSITHIKCSHRGTGPKQIDVGLTENLSLWPDFRDDPSARFSFQESDAFCIPDGVAHSYNACITEEDAEWEVRVGQEGYATRWKKGSVLRYIICTETFPNPQWAELVAREVAKAVSMWENIGARFEEVGRDKTATFAIQYCPKPDNCRPDVYARAFFPKTSRGELFVYQLALERSNVKFLANILAHELGHILGLSHEFAIHTSFLWGKKNDQSVMNYFSDLGQLQVRQQDREDLATYYECEEGKYKKLFITDIEPKLYRFPRSNGYSVGSYRSTLKRLYLNCGIKQPLLLQFVANSATRGMSIICRRFSLPFPFVRLCCAFGLFVFLVCCVFLLRQM